MAQNEEKKYRWIKCALCDYAFVSKANKPKCSKCGSIRTNEVNQMPKNKEEEKQETTENKAQEEKSPAEEVEDFFDEEYSWNTVLDED